MEGRVFVKPKTHKTQNTAKFTTHTATLSNHPQREKAGMSVPTWPDSGDPVQPSEISPRRLLRWVPISDDPFRICFNSFSHFPGFGGIRSGLLLICALVMLLFVVFVGRICIFWIGRFEWRRCFFSSLFPSLISSPICGVWWLVGFFFSLFFCLFASFFLLF